MHLVLRAVHKLGRRSVVVPFGFALGAFFGFLAIQGIDWSQVRGQLAGASPVALAGALALVLLSAYLRSFRWRRLFVGQRITTRRLFLVENASLGLNNVSPVRLLDEPAIITMLTFRDRIPTATVLATLVMTRIMDTSMTIFLAAIALAIEPTLASWVLPAAVAGAAFIFVMGGILNIHVLERRIPLIGRIPGLHHYEAAVAQLEAQKFRIGTSALLTGAYWVTLAPMAYVLAEGMGVELSMLQAGIVVVGAIFFATAAPGLPAAFGTFELAVVQLTSIWGVPNSFAVGYGLVLHLMLFLPPIAIAAVVLPREGISLLGRRPTSEAVTDTGPVSDPAND